MSYAGTYSYDTNPPVAYNHDYLGGLILSLEELPAQFSDIRSWLVGSGSSGSIDFSSHMYLEDPVALGESIDIGSNLNVELISGGVKLYIFAVLYELTPPTGVLTCRLRRDGGELISLGSGPYCKETFNSFLSNLPPAL